VNANGSCCRTDGLQAGRRAICLGAQQVHQPFHSLYVRYPSSGNTSCKMQPAVPNDQHARSRKHGSLGFVLDRSIHIRTNRPYVVRPCCRPMRCARTGAAPFPSLQPAIARAQVALQPPVIEPVRTSARIRRWVGFPPVRSSAVSHLATVNAKGATARPSNPRQSGLALEFVENALRSGRLSHTFGRKVARWPPHSRTRSRLYLGHAIRQI